MARHKGKPSGINKLEGTGIPSKMTPSDVENTDKLTNKYVNEDAEPSSHLRSNKQNRNVDKSKSTNAHGYKN
jgi:hypothetical protein